jgi:hypothetical protein
LERSRRLYEIKEDEVGRACSTHGREEKYNISAERTEGKRTWKA